MKETWMKLELTEFPEVTEAPPETFLRNEKQNKIGVIVTKSGLPFVLSGTVSAFCMLPDGTSFAFSQNGSVSGNRASVELPDECYAQDGRIQISLVLTNDTERTTLGVCRGTVYPTRI